MFYKVNDMLKEYEERKEDHDEAEFEEIQGEKKTEDDQGFESYRTHCEDYSKMQFSHSKYGSDNKFDDTTQLDNVCLDFWLVKGSMFNISRLIKDTYQDNLVRRKHVW